MSEPVDFSMSQLSLNSSDTEDWDRSMSTDADPNSSKTPRNSVSFPGRGGADGNSPSRKGSLGRGAGKRTLSELLKLHAEKGTDPEFTPEEARRVADVLGQWINSSSSPYEGEDDFFTRQGSQDDSSLPNRPSSGAAEPGRPRGQSESVIANNQS